MGKNNKNNSKKQELSTVSNKNDIDLFDEEIKLSENLLTEEELKNEEYKKIPNDMTYMLEPLRQKGAQYILKSHKQKATKKSFEKALEGTFRCELDLGTHLAHRKGQPDVLLGTELDDLTNTISGQAKWRKNDAVPTISKWPDIISGVFDVMSIVTSQFYLNEINTRINDINQKLDKIERRYEIENISQLKSDYDTLGNTLSRINSLKNDKTRFDIYLKTIIEIRDRSKTSIHTFKMNITDTCKKFETNNDKEAKIKENINELNYYLQCYIFSLNNFIFANMLEISLMESPDRNELNLISNDISKYVNESIDFYNNVYKMENNYINKSKCFDPHSFKKTLISKTAAAFETGIEVAFAGETPFDESLKNFSSEASDRLSSKLYEKLYKNREDLLTDCKNKNTIYNNLLFDNQKMPDVINDYAKRIDNKTELVYINGEWYFRNVIEAPDHSKIMMQIQSEQFCKSNQNRKRNRKK